MGQNVQSSLYPGQNIHQSSSETKKPLSLKHPPWSQISTTESKFGTLTQMEFAFSIGGAKFLGVQHSRLGLAILGCTIDVTVRLWRDILGHAI